MGTEAQRHLVDYLFRTTTAHRLEAATEMDNLAEQRALEKVGFRREGVMRGPTSAIERGVTASCTACSVGTSYRGSSFTPARESIEGAVSGSAMPPTAG
ncbi:MAG: GNAT family N-acetyltransferase [Acidimicrobiales bacterium]